MVWYTLKLYHPTYDFYLFVNFFKWVLQKYSSIFFAFSRWPDYTNRPIPTLLKMASIQSNFQFQYIFLPFQRSHVGKIFRKFLGNLYKFRFFLGWDRVPTLSSYMDAPRLVFVANFASYTRMISIFERHPIFGEFRKKLVKKKLNVVKNAAVYLPSLTKMLK